MPSSIPNGVIVHEVVELLSLKIFVRLWFEKPVRSEPEHSSSWYLGPSCIESRNKISEPTLHLHKKAKTAAHLLAFIFPFYFSNTPHTNTYFVLYSFLWLKQESDVFQYSVLPPRSCLKISHIHQPWLRSWILFTFP